RSWDGLSIMDGLGRDGLAEGKHLQPEARSTNKKFHSRPVEPRSPVGTAVGVDQGCDFSFNREWQQQNVAVAGWSESLHKAGIKFCGGGAGGRVAIDDATGKAGAAISGKGLDAVVVGKAASLPSSGDVATNYQ